MGLLHFWRLKLCYFWNVNESVFLFDDQLKSLESSISEKNTTIKLNVILYQLFEKIVENDSHGTGYVSHHTKKKVLTVERRKTGDFKGINCYSPWEQFWGFKCITANSYIAP